MSLESRPHQEKPRLKSMQSLGLKVAGVIMMPLGIYGMYHGSQIDEPIWQAKAEANKRADTSSKAQEKSHADADKSKTEAVIFTLGGLATTIVGFGALMEGIVKSKEKNENKEYIHHIEPWKAFNIFVTPNKLSPAEKREISLPTTRRSS